MDPSIRPKHRKLDKGAVLSTCCDHYRDLKTHTKRANRLEAILKHRDKDHKATLKVIRGWWDASLANQKKVDAGKLAKAKIANKASLLTLKAAEASNLAKATRAHEASLSKLNAAHASTLRKEKIAYEQSLSKEKEAHARKLDKAKRAYELSLSKLRASYQSEQEKTTFLKVGCWEPWDMAVRVQGRSIAAHRFILADKSPVFRKMFEDGMLEKHAGLIEINDASYEVMEAVVSFCYTAEVIFTEEVTPEKVLKVAYMYQIMHLKGVCETELCKRISLENFPQILELTRRYPVKRLRTEALTFFKEHFEELQDRVFDGSGIGFVE